ncbi:MAG: hypothetical protein ACOY9B_01020 [Pseudomonadota bacterium]
MSLNKKALATAVAGALLAGNAYAANISTGGAPAYFAREIIATPAAPVTLNTDSTAGVDATELSWNVGYNFSDNEVRYARVECSGNFRFGSGLTVVSNDPGSVNFGSINGIGTNVLTFSVTSLAAGGNVQATDTFTITGDHQITGTSSDVVCNVALYDQPSQAQAGGTTGRIPNSLSAGPYLAFRDSYNFTSTPFTATADVSTDYLDFLASGDTTAATAELASWVYDLVDPDAAGPQTAPYDIDGSAITLADLMATGATGTRIVVSGDFSYATSAFLSSGGNCATPIAGMTATITGGNTATFNVGATALPAGTSFCVTRNGTTAIPVTDYTAQLIAVSAAPTTYAVTNRGPHASGSIVRNGTELQAPLVQLPSGYLSRIMLTNTGSVARNYRIRVIGETGNVISTNAANMSGTIPANGSRFFETNTFITGFSAGTRATVIITVDAPTNQIQGLYQIVNPANGSISNHVMVRPGTN